MTALKKIMNDEIQKYQGRIYYLDIRKDIYGNLKSPRIERADWIENTQCYDHCSFELHHIIKFTQFEKMNNFDCPNAFLKYDFTLEIPANKSLLTFGLANILFS